VTRRVVLEGLGKIVGGYGREVDDFFEIDVVEQ